MKLNDNFRKREDEFSKEVFNSAPKSYSPFYSWLWNAPVTREETDRQLDEFERLGIKAFYIIPEPKTFRPTSIPTMLEPDYLTVHYFEAYAYALKSAFARGMIAWIYDEGGWPSGGACGKVLLKHPELARRGLGQKITHHKAGESFAPEKETVSAFLPDGTLIESGYKFSEDSDVSEYFSERYYFKWPSLPDYPDLTLAESADAFIEETFPGYEHTLSDYFGGQISAVFSDEPEAPRPVPYRPETEKEYERRYGESIRPHLDVLWKNIERLWGDYEDVSVPQESAQAIIKWYDLCSELFCRNFLDRERKWSNDHNLSFVGHLNGDDLPMGSVRSACYHVLRSLRRFDIPAVDVIWRQIFPGEKKKIADIVTSENRFFPRYASSAAAQIGSDLSASESFGVYGQSLTYDNMRYTIGFQAVRGINIFNFMVKSYGRTGFFMSGERPSFGEDFHKSNELKAFNEYTERLTYVTSLGERLVNVALYFPMCDVWSGAYTKTICEGYEKAGFELEECGIYFDVLDDDVLRECDNDALNLGAILMGNAKYDTVIIPPTQYIPKDVVKRLEGFISSGGRVIAVRSSLTPEISGAEIVDDCEGLLRPDISIDFSSGNLRTYSKETKSGRMDMIFNQGYEKEIVTLDVVGKAPLLIDITFGKLRSLDVCDGKAHFSLESGETIALLYNDEAFEVEKSNNFERELTINDEFLFKRCEQFVIGDMEPCFKKFEEEPITVKLGDWRNTLGECFSGSCSYSAEFKRPEGVGDAFILDLGRVAYSAEVILNGEAVGNLIMPPYTMKLSSKLLKDKNHLEIQVLGSVANEYKYTKEFEKFAKWQLSPYHDKQIAFCDDNLSGGLFGPVKIHY